MSLITSTTGCCSCGATYYAYPCWASSSHYFDATTQAPFGDPPNSPRRDDSVFNVNFNGECPSDFPPPAGTDIIVMLRGAGGGSSPVFPIAGGGGGATIEFQTKVDTSLKVLVGRGGQYSIAAFFPAFTNTWGGGGLGAWGNIGFNTFGYSNGGGASGIQIGEDDFSIIYVAGAGGGAGTPGSGFAGGAGGLELGGDGGGSGLPGGELDYTLGQDMNPLSFYSLNYTGGSGAEFNVGPLGGGGGGGGGYFGGTGGDYSIAPVTFAVTGRGGGGGSSEFPTNSIREPGLVGGLVSANPFFTLSSSTGPVPADSYVGFGMGGSSFEGLGKDGRVVIQWRTCDASVDSMPKGLPPNSFVCITAQQRDNIISQAGATPEPTAEQIAYGDLNDAPCKYRYIGFTYKGWPYYIAVDENTYGASPLAKNEVCSRNIPDADIVGPFTWRIEPDYCCQIWTADLLDPPLDTPDVRVCSCDTTDLASPDGYRRKIYLSDQYRKTLGIPDCLDARCHILTYPAPEPEQGAITPPIVRKYKLAPPKCCSCPHPNSNKGPIPGDCADQNLCNPWNPEGITYSVEAVSGLFGDTVCEYLVCNTFLGGLNVDATPFSISWDLRPQNIQRNYGYSEGALCLGEWMGYRGNESCPGGPPLVIDPCRTECVGGGLDQNCLGVTVSPVEAWYCPCGPGSTHPPTDPNDVCNCGTISTEMPPDGSHTTSWQRYTCKNQISYQNHFCTRRIPPGHIYFLQSPQPQTPPCCGGARCPGQDISQQMGYPGGCPPSVTEECSFVCPPKIITRKPMVCFDPWPCWTPDCGWLNVHGHLTTILGNTYNSYVTGAPGSCTETWAGRTQDRNGCIAYNVPPPTPCEPGLGYLTQQFTVGCAGLDPTTTQWISNGNTVPCAPDIGVNGWSNCWSTAYQDCENYSCHYQCLYTMVGAAVWRPSCFDQSYWIAGGAALTNSDCPECAIASKHRIAAGQINLLVATQNPQRTPYSSSGSIDCPLRSDFILFPNSSSKTVHKQWEELNPWKEVLKVEYIGSKSLSDCLTCDKTGGDCCSPRPGEKGCSSAACVAAVVAATDNHCTEVEWDHICANRARKYCATCSHGLSLDCCSPIPNHDEIVPPQRLGWDNLPWQPGVNDPFHWSLGGVSSVPTTACESAECTAAVCAVRPYCCEAALGFGYAICPPHPPGPACYDPNNPPSWGFYDPPGWTAPCAELARELCPVACTKQGDLCCQARGPCTDSVCLGKVTGILNKCNSTFWDSDCAHIAKRECVNCNGSSWESSSHFGGFTGIWPGKFTTCQFYPITGPDFDPLDDYVYPNCNLLFTGVILNNHKYRGCGTVEHFATEINSRESCYKATLLQSEDPYWIGQRCYGGKTCCDSIQYPLPVASSGQFSGAYEDFICHESLNDCPPSQQGLTVQQNLVNCGRYCSSTREGDEFRIKSCSVRDTNCFTTQPTTAESDIPVGAEAGWCESPACKEIVSTKDPEMVNGQIFYPFEYCLTNWDTECVSAALEVCNFLDRKYEMVFEARYKHWQYITPSRTDISQADLYEDSCANTNCNFDPNLPACVAATVTNPVTGCSCHRSGDGNYLSLCPDCCPCTMCCYEEGSAEWCGYPCGTCREVPPPESFNGDLTYIWVADGGNGTDCGSGSSSLVANSGSPLSPGANTCFNSRGDIIVCPKVSTISLPKIPLPPIILSSLDVGKCDLGGYAYGTAECDMVVCQHAVQQQDYNMRWTCISVPRYVCTLLSGLVIPNMTHCPGYTPPS